MIVLGQSRGAAVLQRRGLIAGELGGSAMQTGSPDGGDVVVDRRSRQGVREREARPLLEVTRLEQAGRHRPFEGRQSVVDPGQALGENQAALQPEDGRRDDQAMRVERAVGQAAEHLEAERARRRKWTVRGATQPLRRKLLQEGEGMEWTATGVLTQALGSLRGQLSVGDHGG
ncbi:MAG: hypothetical protein E6I76_20010, partial [Chloroflexi bacterium]